MTMRLVPPWWWRPQRHVKAAVKRWWWFARGRYDAGVYYVDAVHWWSPEERKAARIAAVILKLKAEEIEREMRAEMSRLLIFGTSYRKADWN
jgi:hypothetical protein